MNNRLLLIGLRLFFGGAWVNIVLHYVIPVVVVLDWLYQPQLSKLSVRQSWIWLVFSLFYLVYSLIRGPIAQWYPYPFLNPDQVGGYGGVALYCMAILAGFVAFGWLLMQTGNKLRRHVA